MLQSGGRKREIRINLGKRIFRKFCVGTNRKQWGHIRLDGGFFPNLLLH
jgi:hypothetical protein